MLKNRMKAAGMIICLFAIALSGGACRQDMHDNPRYEAYEEGNQRELPEGTVARGSLDANPAAPKVEGARTMTAQPVASPGTPTGAGAATTAVQTIPVGEDGFPFRITREILERGESRYNITCLPCHGKLGDGGGMIVQRGFRRPPSYHDERLRKAPSGHFYDVVTNGFGAMSNYADQLTPEDRWKVIAYIRALQLSQRADVNSLAESDRKKLEESEKSAASANGHGSSSGGPRN